MGSTAESTLPYDPAEADAQGLELVAYHDLEKRGSLKMGLHVAGDRWYLYLGGLWEPGVSIVDVTDPANPELLKWMGGPENSFGFQVQVADGKLIHGIEMPFQGYGFGDGATYREGFDIYDLADPADPALLGSWSTGNKPTIGADWDPDFPFYNHGTHRNWYDGGRYVHAAATADGFQNYIYRIVDIQDPSNPTEVGRWWTEGQYLAGGRTEHSPWKFLHGPAWIEGDRAYCPWAEDGLIILDISDLSRPKKVSGLNLAPGLGSELGLHTVVPIPERQLLVMNSEAIAEGGSKHEPINYTAIVDISDETKPRVISLLPVPEPPAGAPYASYHERGGRFGPHNQHHHQHNPHLLNDENKVYLAYFNAGLRVYDISDPYTPRETAYYVAPDPTERWGPLPKEKLTMQCEDVLVDSRGYIYTTDKNYGLHIHRETA